MKITTALSVLALVSSALALPSNTKKSDNSCVSPICCAQITTASDPAAATILGLLGIVVTGDNGSVGLTCSAYNSIGTCDTKPQCCAEPNVGNGIIALGCRDLE